MLFSENLRVVGIGWGESCISRTRSVQNHKVRSLFMLIITAKMNSNDRVLYIIVSQLVNNENFIPLFLCFA